MTSRLVGLLLVIVAVGVAWLLASDPEVRETPAVVAPLVEQNLSVESQAPLAIVDRAPTRLGDRVVGTDARVLRVLALDDQQRPIADAGVRLSWWDVDGERWRHGAKARTDADGMAHFADVASTLASAPERRWVVMGDVLGGAAPYVPLDPTIAASSLVELLFPPAGAVTVEVSGLGGGAVPDGSSVWLRAVAASSRPPDGDDAAQGPQLHSLEGKTQGGRAVFPRIGLGGQLTARAAAHPWNGSLGPETFDGPRAAGQHVTVRLHAADSGGTLTGRVLDEFGKRLAITRVVLDLDVRNERGGRVGRHTAVLATDDDARWTIALPPRKLAGRSFLLVVHPEGEPSRDATHEGLLPTTPQELDVGDLQLSEQELIVRGRVFGPSGDARAGASVHAFAKLAEPPSKSAFHERFEVETDVDGRYELRSRAAMVSVRLQAKESGFAPSAVADVHAPNAAVDLSLTPAASLSGVVRVGAVFAMDELTVQIDPDPVTSKSHVHWSGLAQSIDDEGRYRFEDLPPGRYSVEVRLNDVFSWDHLASVHDVEVGAGENATAPLIDIASLVNEFRVDVVDEGGAPIAKGTGSYWAPETGDSSDLVIEAGVATIRTRHDSVIAWFGAAGRRTVQIPELAGDARVVLPSPHRVRVRLADPGAIPPEPYVLWIRCWSGIGFDNWVLSQLTDVGDARFDRAGEALVDFNVARTYSYQLYVSGALAGHDGDTARTRVEIPAPARLSIGDDDDEQLIDIEVDPAAVMAAIEQLGH